jgi:hypothetical protein
VNLIGGLMLWCTKTAVLRLRCEALHSDGGGLYGGGMRRVTQVGVECHLGGARSCTSATAPSIAEGTTAGNNEERRCNAWHLTLTTMCKRGWSRWASMVGCVGVDPPIPAGAHGQFGGLQASGKSFAWHSTGAHNVDTFGCRLPRWRCCVDAPW